MTHDFPLLQRFYNLGTLGRAGDEVTVTARGEELAPIAAWAEIRSVETLSATIDLQKHSPVRFSYDAELRAEITQDCVVTLEPVRSKLQRTIHRELHLTENAQTKTDVVVDPNAADDDISEEISSLHYDLAGPLLEELVLALDPYPRAPGVAFEPPNDHEPEPESPFAVLKKLKNP